MSKSIKRTKPVSAATIRQAFRDGTLNVADVKNEKGEAVNPASIFGADGTGQKVRGRLNPAFVAAYLAANPTASYAEKSVAEKRTVMLPLVSAKTGKAIKPVEVTVTEARALAGVPGGKGRLSADTLAKAAAAFQSQGK